MSVLKNKICHLTSVHPRNDTRIFYKECKSLSKSYQVSLIVADGKEDKTITDIDIYDVGKPKNRIDRMLNITQKVYQKALSIDADIYHFHDPELIPIGLKLKKKGKKVIYDIHEDYPRQNLSKDYIPKPLRRIIFNCLETYENYAAKIFDALITATPFINNRFFKLNKISLNINNYPIIDEFNIDLRWEDKKQEVCYIGGIAKIRGIIEIIDSMEYINGNLNLAGKFETTQIRKEVIIKKGWEKVKEYGFVNRDKVHEILSNSILGLAIFHPEENHINSQPNKIFEYMSSKIPVVASNFPLWKEIIEKNNCGICVNPLKPKEIANAVNYLLSNPDIAQEMGKNGRIAVEKKYNWDIEIKKLLKLYNIL
jgi:glycosyltransferase involved in cell wall biosynthesis